MAYIEPNSTIRLLAGCPLDKTYDHTIYFASQSAQTSYFQSLTKYTYTNYSYIRQLRTIKVQADAGANLYDCNYLMFRNNSFENKWFYAFVTSIEYVNNYTWEIGFELDVMQSWMFDYELEECFVEREHSATDNLFENLVPENLELGDYISEGISRCADTGSATESLLEDLSLVFACTFDRNYADYQGGYYGGLYSGLCLIDFPFPNPANTTNIQTFVSNIRTWINGATGAGKPTGIICAFVMPTAFVRSDTSTHTQLGFTKSIAFNSIDGYAPKNKKLFSFPYNFLYCTNFQGQSAPFKFEYFSTPTAPSFKLEADYSPDPNIVLTPLNYKGAGANGNYDEKMVLGGYPQLPFSTDVFQAWLAMGSGNTIVSAISSISGYAVGGALAGGVPTGGAGAIPGALIGAGVGIGSTILKSLETAREQYIEPWQSHNGAGSTTMASIRLIDFGFMHKHIRSEFARIIDDYFNMFGYATKRCKVPNTHVRPHWTYTKTIGCCAVGSVPAEDMRKICSLYDKGITFWMNGDEVGNYSLDNRPV